jgi:hypothetical protein
VGNIEAEPMLVESAKMLMEFTGKKLKRNR